MVLIMWCVCSGSKLNNFRLKNKTQRLILGAVVSLYLRLLIIPLKNNAKKNYINKGCLLNYHYVKAAKK